MLASVRQEIRNLVVMGLDPNQPPDQAAQGSRAVGAGGAEAEGFGSSVRRGAR